MLDHIGYAVTDLDRSTRFYQAALAPLSITVLMEVTAEQTGKEAAVGFGANGKPFFWVGTGATSRVGTRGIHRDFPSPGRRLLQGSHCCGREGQRSARYPRALPSYVLWGIRIGSGR